MITIEVNGTVLSATLVQNSSTEAFLGLLAEGPLTLQLHEYGGFEKVGSLGTSLPTNDEPITTTPGDIILYQGDKITLYYDVNSWTFTRLGHIVDVDEASLRELFGAGDIEATFSLAD